MSSHSISLKAIVESRAEAAQLLKAPGDAVLIKRGIPRWLLLRCPCDCGEDLPVNLDARSGKAWRLYQSPSAGLTLFPSVWRDTGCESHFIIWRDKILMFGVGSGGGRSPRDSIDLETLARRVLEAWPEGSLVSYVEVADKLREIPWDIQEACKYLVNAGALVEAEGLRRGTFRRAAK